MSINKGQIGNALESVAPDHIVTTADQIFDENLGKYQNEINQDGGGGYTPPVGGIPKSDLASDVQTSLGKADDAVPNTRKVNGKVLSSDITLNAGDVGALPSSTTIPTSLSQLGDDSTHRTVTDSEKTDWNDKYTKTEVDNMLVSAPEANVVVIENPSGADPTTLLPQTPATNTIYRVMSADGTYFSEYEHNGTKYVKLADRQYGIERQPKRGSENAVISDTIYGLQQKISDVTPNIYNNKAWHHSDYLYDRNDAICSINEFPVTAGESITWVCGAASTEAHNCALIFCGQNGDALTEEWYAANAYKRVISVPEGAYYAKASFVKGTFGSGVFDEEGNPIFIPCSENGIDYTIKELSDSLYKEDSNAYLCKAWDNGNNLISRNDAVCSKEIFAVTPGSTIRWICGTAITEPYKCVLYFCDSNGDALNDGWYAANANERLLEVPAGAVYAKASFVLNTPNAGVYGFDGSALFIPKVDGLQKQIFDNDNDLNEIKDLSFANIAGNVYVGKGYHNSQVLKNNNDTVCTKELVPVTGGQTIFWVCGVAEVPGHSDLLVYDTEGVFITDEYYAAYAERRTITLPENAGFVHASFVRSYPNIGIYDDENNPIFIPVIPSLQNQIINSNSQPGGSEENVVGSYVGAVNTWVDGSKMTFLAKGGKYRVSLADKDFARDDITIPTGQAYLFEVYNVYNGVETALAGTTVGGVVSSYYDFVVPENSDYVAIGGRANEGVKVQYSIQQIFEDEGSSYGLVLPKAGDFSMLLSAAQGKIESFILFSDPHWFTSYNTVGMRDATKAYPYEMKKYWDNTSTDFVLCGGDWLIEHKKSVAIKDLAIIDGFMNRMFDFKYYPVYGNHDNNYQGEQDGTSDRSANDGVLTNQQMINLWFRKYGKMYYTFNGINTKFYVFDSGLDWGAYNPMNEYKWQQIDWFANSLLSGSDDNIVAVLHIVDRTAEIPSQFGNDIAPLAQNVSLVAQAFNSKTSITLNGVTYNFSGTTGKVRCIICGHTHFDTTYVLNNIPVFCETTSMNNLNFDLVVIDYNEYKLKSVRIGQGEDRVMNIVQ